MSRINLKKFLSEEGMTAISAAVKEAESRTSGEIKVLVVQSSINPGDKITHEEAANTRAEKEFMNLGIQQTEGHTGVLIMVSLDERQVVVKADKAIDEKVEAGTWDFVVTNIIDGIKRNVPAEGICAAVRWVGQYLAQYFPIQEDDRNELSDGVELRE